MPPIDSQDISLDALWFFGTHALGIIAVCALVFFILGVWVGFLTWAKFKRRARAYFEELQIQRTEIANLKRRITEDTSDTEAEENPTPLLSPTLLEPAPPKPTVQPKQTTVVTEVVPASVTSRPPPEPKRDSLAAAVLGRPNKPKVIEVTPLPAEEPKPASLEPLPAIPASELEPAPSPSASESSSEIVPPPAPPTQSPNELARVVEAVMAASAAAANEKPAEPPSASRPLGSPGGMAQVLAKSVDESRPLSTAEPAKIAATIAPSTTSVEPSDGQSELDAALRSGRAAVDEKLGIVYHERPERYDDLTLLRGVGDALHTKLQELGIYTFRQIAMWSDAQIREFDARLVAKDRIRREQWIKQARNLHFLKYGEQLKQPVDLAA